MKTCLKCQKEFSVRTKIDGKIKNLQNRKYCLECSPFGLHNTKDLILNDIGEDPERICAKCNILKPRSEYYTRRKHSRSTYSPYCKVCVNSSTISRQRKIKQQAVSYMGGKCSCCGYDKYLGALEFHHKNPAEKDFAIGEIKNSSFQRMIPELQKCVLVCANCHKEIHGGIIKIPD